MGVVGDGSGLECVISRAAAWSVIVTVGDARIIVGRWKALIGTGGGFDRFSGMLVTSLLRMSVGLEADPYGDWRGFLSGKI